MHVTQRKQQFSIAYVRAVAASVGYGISNLTEVDDESVDLTISARGPFATVHSPRLEAQLKCTAVIDRTTDPMSFRIDGKNYNDLRVTNLADPKVLIVVAVPVEPTDWLLHSDYELALRHCGYWLSLRGAPDLPAGQDRATVHIPRGQVLSTGGLEDLMRRVGAGEKP